jgi:glucokinase
MNAPRQNGPRLIADIGGTNARFALLDGRTWRGEKVLACADYPDIVSAIEDYLKSADASRGSARPVEGALAIAGPITGDIVRMTNHVWQFSAAPMAIRHLPPDELEQIGGGQAMPGAPLALLGPGTGLGVSGLIPAGEHWIALQGEGGHVTLSVMNEREIAVLQQLHQRFTHVSAERVICGPGLLNLYDAICALEA